MIVNWNLDLAHYFFSKLALLPFLGIDFFSLGIGSFIFLRIIDSLFSLGMDFFLSEWLIFFLELLVRLGPEWLIQQYSLLYQYCSHKGGHVQ